MGTLLRLSERYCFLVFWSRAFLRFLLAPFHEASCEALDDVCMVVKRPPYSNFSAGIPKAHLDLAYLVLGRRAQY